jgi:hypothetical protein
MFGKGLGGQERRNNRADSFGEKSGAQAEIPRGTPGSRVRPTLATGETIVVLRRWFGNCSV